MSKCVLQPWVLELTYMMQSVLIAAVRGPDGLRKDHPSKLLCRWLRRCFLVSAFDDKGLTDPVHTGGGSFTGPSVSMEEIHGDRAKHIPLPPGAPFWYPAMVEKMKDYLRFVDEMPHHFQLHFCHAAEILGYKHSDSDIRRFWNTAYVMIANDAHLRPETEYQLDQRLGDSEKQWRAAEVVTASPPPIPAKQAWEGPEWLKKIYKGESYITIVPWDGEFEICGYRSDDFHKFDGLGKFPALIDAVAEVRRRYKTVRLISAASDLMELAVS